MHTLAIHPPLCPVSGPESPVATMARTSAEFGQNGRSHSCRLFFVSYYIYPDNMHKLAAHLPRVMPSMSLCHLGCCALPRQTLNDLDPQRTAGIISRLLDIYTWYNFTDSMHTLAIHPPLCHAQHIVFPSWLLRRTRLVYDV